MMQMEDNRYYCSAINTWHTTRPKPCGAVESMWDVVASRDATIATLTAEVERLREALKEAIDEIKQDNDFCEGWEDEFCQSSCRWRQGCRALGGGQG